MTPSPVLSPAARSRIRSLVMTAAHDGAAPDVNNPYGYSRGADGCEDVRRRPGGGNVDDDDDLTLLEAAVHLGMSPAALAELLDRGSLPSHLGTDGRRRRIRLADLEAHRASRFALRQQLAQQARDRRRPTYGPESTTADVVIVA